MRYAGDELCLIGLAVVEESRLPFNLNLFLLAMKLPPAYLTRWRDRQTIHLKPVNR
jgi:hypothetical protein